MRKIWKYAFVNAIGTALYVFAVGAFVYSLGQSASGIKSVFIPIAMLMLLVFSVAFVGSLIFGRPAMWYVDGKKKDALLLLFYTLVIFLVITAGVFGVLVGVVGV